MKRYSFSSFLVDDSNRKAYQICQDFAELRPVEPQPVLLLGDESSGKTHLLYSIVNRVRASSARAGIAYMSGRVSEEVRALLDDPRPVQEAEHAILLVDQLEQFSELMNELEQIARLFLEQGHYIMLASNIHPSRLTNIPAGLRQLVLSGQVVVIDPHGAETQLEVVRRQVLADNEGELSRQREEIENLRQLLENTQQAVQSNSQPETPRLRSELETAHAELENLRTEKLRLAMQLESKPQDDGLAKRLDEAQAELARLRAENQRIQEELQAEKAMPRAPETEVEGLAQRLAEAEREQVKAQQKLAEFQAAWESLEAGRTSLQEDRALLDNEKTAVAAARAACDRQRAELERERAGLAAVQAELEHERAAVGPVQEEFETVQAAVNQEKALLESLRKEAETARAELTHHQAELAHASDMHATGREMLDSLRAQLSTEQAAFDTERAEFEQRQHVFTQESRALLQRYENLEHASTELEERASSILEGARQAVAQLDEGGGRLARFEAEREAQAAELRSMFESARAMADARPIADQASMDALHTELANVKAQLEEAHAQLNQRMSAIEDIRVQLEQERAARLESEEQWALRMHEQGNTLKEAQSGEQAALSRFEQSQSDLAALRAELSELRKEAAGQVAEAQAYSGELEGRLARLHTETVEARESRANAEARLRMMQERVSAAKKLLHEISAPVRQENDILLDELGAQDAPAASHEA